LNYKLFQGDCLNVLPSFPNKFFQVCLTSPPFKDEEVPLLYYEWLDKVLKELVRVSDIVVMFNSSLRLKEICRRTDPRRILIWDKMVGMGAYRYEPIFIYANDDEKLDGKGRIWNDCLRYAPIVGKNQLVPYQNPVGLYEQLLRYFPEKQLLKHFPEKESVLDPFLGSGTTIEASQNLGRSCVGIEIKPENCDIIKKRCFIRQFLDRKVNYEFIEWSRILGDIK